MNSRMVRVKISRFIAAPGKQDTLEGLVGGEEFWIVMPESRAMRGRRG